MAQANSTKLFIRVKPGSRTPGIERLDETHWIVKVREPPVDGKANRAVVEAVAGELGLPRSRVRLLRGEGSKEKVLEIV